MWKSTVLWLQVFLILLLCGQMSRLVNIWRKTHWTSLMSTELKLENTDVLQTTLVERHLQWWTLMCDVRRQLDLFTWDFSWKGLIRRAEELYSLENECTRVECLGAVNDKLALVGPFLTTCNNSISLSTKKRSNYVQKGFLGWVWSRTILTVTLRMYFQPSRNIFILIYTMPYRKKIQPVIIQEIIVYS